MGCKLTEPLSEKTKKKYKNFIINHSKGILTFVNPMLKISKIGSKKYRHGKK